MAQARASPFVCRCAFAPTRVFFRKQVVTATMREGSLRSDPENVSRLMTAQPPQERTSRTHRKMNLTTRRTASRLTQTPIRVAECYAPPTPPRYQTGCMGMENTRLCAPRVDPSDRRSVIETSGSGLNERPTSTRYRVFVPTDGNARPQWCFSLFGTNAWRMFLCRATQTTRGTRTPQMGNRSSSRFPFFSSRTDAQRPVRPGQKRSRRANHRHKKHIRRQENAYEYVPNNGYR